MSKQLLIVLVVVLVIGGLTFFDQVLAIFHGLTVLEALEMIMNYVLHVAVVTVVGFVVFGLPEVVKPWLQMYRQSVRSKRRALRRRRGESMPSLPKSPRVNKDHVLMWLASRMSQAEKPRKTQAQQPADEPRFDL